MENDCLVIDFSKDFLNYDMEKENGKWDIPENTKNAEFRMIINMGFLRFVEIYTNEKIYTEYEFEL